MAIVEIDLGKIQPLWRGEFSPTPVTNYEPLDNLSYLDTVYICIQEGDGSQLPTDTDYFRPVIDLTTYKVQSVMSFAVSQYANGDASKVAAISAGLPIASYDYFVDQNTLQVFAKNGATGTFSDPLVFDPTDGSDTGIDEPLSVLGVNTKVLGVNQSTTDVTASRVTGDLYENDTEKPIFLSIEIGEAATGGRSLEIDGVEVCEVKTTAGNTSQISFIVLPGQSYSFPTGNFIKWVEVR